MKNIIENHTLERTAKFIEMKGIVTLVKVDEVYNILKILLATCYWSRYEDGTGWLLLEPAL